MSRFCFSTINSNSGKSSSTPKYFASSKTPEIHVIEPGNEMYGNYFYRICLSARMYVRSRKQSNMISTRRRGITRVASHGKHTRATEHVNWEQKNFT